jgi:hypothetical protein
MTECAEPVEMLVTELRDSPAQPALKEQYLKCFRARQAGEAMLPGFIKSLLRLGTHRQTLVRWAVESGCSESYARSLLSKILCALGFRQRRPGAGRKLSREVLELVAEARQRYGDRHLKILRAAYREGKAQAEAAARLPLRAVSTGCGESAASQNVHGLIAVPQ